MSRLSVFQLGPLSLPLPWLIFLLFALAGALVAALLSRGYPAVRKRVIDVGLNALFAYFVAWKLSPLLTAFRTVTRSPLSLLYLPGDAIGILLGIAAAAAVVAVALRTSEASSRRRIAFGLGLWTGIVAVGAGGGWLLLPPLPTLNAQAAAPIGHEVGDRAPTLTLTDLTGERVTLPAARGGSDIVILNFWATWCPPCRGELPEIAKFVASLDRGEAAPARAPRQPAGQASASAAGRRAAVRLYAINLTSTEPTDGAPSGAGERVTRFLDRMHAAGLVPHVLLDTSGIAQRMYAINSVPTTVILRGGRIIAVHPGVVDASWLRQAAAQVERGTDGS